MKELSLQIAAVGVALLVGAPLLFAPLRWARAIGWALPEDTRLTRYFGRCLGAVVLVLAALAFHGSRHPGVLPVALATTAAAMLLMVPVHVVGALEKSQPAFETWETLVYLGGGCFFAWLTVS
jgi:zinc transporter ZupT